MLIAEPARQAVALKYGTGYLSIAKSQEHTFSLAKWNWRLLHYLSVPGLETDINTKLRNPDTPSHDSFLQQTSCFAPVLAHYDILLPRTRA